jgi:molybdopterin-guanine dinucleotide biosynthesis protein A
MTGVILAGGKARRMEGQDKAFVLFQGRPLVQYVLTALKGLVSEVIINTYRSSPEYVNLGCRLIADPTMAFEGPLVGVLVSMRASKTPWILVVPCDMPLLKEVHLRRLLDRVMDGNDVVVAHDGARIQPLLMCVRTSLATNLARFLDEGGRRVEEWICLQSFVTVDLSDEPEALANFNSKTDLLAFESNASSRSSISNSSE